MYGDCTILHYNKTRKTTCFKGSNSFKVPSLRFSHSDHKLLKSIIWSKLSFLLFSEKLTHAFSISVLTLRIQISSRFICLQTRPSYGSQCSLPAPKFMFRFQDAGFCRSVFQYVFLKTENNKIKIWVLIHRKPWLFWHFLNFVHCSVHVNY